MHIQVVHLCLLCKLFAAQYGSVYAKPVEVIVTFAVAAENLRITCFDEIMAHLVQLKQGNA